MFVRIVNKLNNRVSIRIVENKRIDNKVKQKTVTGIGTAHKDDLNKINSLKRIGEDLIIKLKNEVDPVLPGLEDLIHSSKKKIKNNIDTDLVSINGLKEKNRVHHGINDIFGSIFEQLDLFNSIDTGYKKDESNQLLKEVVLARISNPMSKKKSIKNIEIDKNIKLDLDKLYRMMDKVYDNTERIKNKISDSTLSLFKQKVDVAFFDVTTLYFESFAPDNLRVSGFSKDGKFKETQVMLALITTTDGLPLGYELFPGNSYEGNTLITVIEQVEKNYDLSNTFVVADRAMFTKPNLQKLDDKKIKFIIAVKLKTMNSEMKKQITDDVSKALEIEKNLKGWTKDYLFEDRRLIVNYSQKRANKDKKDRNRLVERIQKKMKDGKVRLADLINNTGTKKYLKIDKKGSKEATLNKLKIIEHAKWDGIHAVITNQENNSLDSNEILKRYRNLWQIEAAFRLNKHDLKMRPIYHWTEKRIRAHILICFIAYSLVAYAKNNLKNKNIKLSFEETKDELNRVQASIVKDKITGREFILPSKITATQKIIYNAFDIKLNNRARLIRN